MFEVISSDFTYQGNEKIAEDIAITIESGVSNFMKNRGFIVLNSDNTKLYELYSLACANSDDFNTFIKKGKIIVDKHYGDESDTIFSLLKLASNDLNFINSNLAILIKQTETKKPYTYGHTHKINSTHYEICIQADTDVDIPEILFHEIGHIVCELFSGDILKVPDWFSQLGSDDIELFANLYAYYIISKNNIKLNNPGLKNAVEILYNVIYTHSIKYFEKI